MGNIRYKGGNYTRSARPVLIEKEITANGTYIASDDNADGYSEVTVDVAEQNNTKLFYFGSYASSFVVNASIVEKIEIPEGYTGLNTSTSNTSLKMAVSLKEIKLPSTITTLASDMFSYCHYLEKITINKPEGSITGAPWGAPASCQIVWLG